MKKRIITTLFALAVMTHALAGGADISIKPRLEGAYNSIFSNFENDNDFGLGWSSLYTMVDGSISDHFSYYAQFHFLSSMPKYLYKYEYPCVNGTWVDMAYMSYNRDFWGIDLGKIFFNFGGMINEYDDVDCYSGFVPFEWTYFNTYQYGLTFRLTPWENHSFEAQLATSPSMDTGFDDIMLAYGLCWRGEMGRFTTSWAVNGMRDYTYAEDEFEFDGEEEESDLDEYFDRCNTINIGLGNNFEINDRWSIGLDAFLNLFDGKLDDWNYSDFELTGAFNASESLCVKAQVGLKSVKKFSFGALVEYYPIENLRLHACVNYCDNDDEDFFLVNKKDYTKPFEANIGITYTLDFHLGK